MRRQARISGGGALVVRSASALQVWLWLLIFIFQNEFRISRSIQPGYLDFDNLPDTNFTCAGKVIGGYYADLETSCQMFHVCTVGQQDEPMDIKFLCLNGTVFDQETRVCERVDEVDCTKSEKFYSLNLELYGSTLPPPVIQADVPKTESKDQSNKKPKPNAENADPTIDDSSTTTHSKIHEISTDVIDSTEDPVQDIKKDDQSKTQDFTSTHHSLSDQEEAEEYQDEGDEDIEYEEDYAQSPSTTTTQIPTTTTTTTTTTTRRPTPTTTVQPSTSLHYLSPVPQLISSPLPTISSVSPSVISPSASPSPSHLLSPQEFIYRHRGPGSEAISFQSFRPADGVYITHAPPQQFDHFQYESSRTAPKPTQLRPTPFVQRPQPAPFRPTTLDPRDQLLRPGPSSQSSERHETSIKHRPQSYSPVLPAQRPLPFNPYYYDRKRSDDSSSEVVSSLAARSVAPVVTVTERPPTKPKSPPRVIVTASASVSDSNGKRLNYTVGNVVSAVKPIVPINYDDYKESDLIFDPFFLDVPKLQKRRKTRSNVRNRRTFTIPATVTLSPNLMMEKRVKTTNAPVTSRATTTSRPTTTTSRRTTTAAWNINDYVDDNYEPQAYIPPDQPPAVIIAHDVLNYKKQEGAVARLAENKSPQEMNPITGRIELAKSTVSARTQQTTSSQSADDRVASSAASLSPPPPLKAYSCATSRSTDCRTRT